MKPAIIVPEFGIHNRDLQASKKRLMQGQTYKDLSTICIIASAPGHKPHPRVLSSWFNMMIPMNQKFVRMWPYNMEVGQAYSATLEAILANADLCKWKYILTLEADNIIPPDALLMLLESINLGMDVVGSLYWTKGVGGQPMIYGNPGEMPRNFIPQLPQENTLQRCNGLGMGMTLFKLSIFKDQGFQKPFFRTVQDYQPGVGARNYTQDLFFFEMACTLGYKIACDTRVRVGHYDEENDIVW